MKKTVFYDFHQQHGGKMVPFAGYEMPVEFSGVKNEHNFVRNSVGVFDVSHMGEIWIRGAGAEEFLQRITSNDVRNLTPGKIQYSCMPNRNAGIVDDLLVYKFSNEEFLLVVNASNIEKDFNWILENNYKETELINESDQYSQLAVQGPDATSVLQKISPIDLERIPYYSFVVGSMGGREQVIISNTGYTGAGGFEIYMKNEDGPAIMEAIMEAGKGNFIIPVGLAARDTLRLEMGFCLYGNDINETTSPLEAGLGWITKFNEGNDFISREILEKQKKEGLKRKLVGFIMEERAIPRKDYLIADSSGNKIGITTSGTMSPYTGKGIGMGYVSIEQTKPGTRIFLQIRNKQVPGIITKPPFFNSNQAI